MCGVIGYKPIDRQDAKMQLHAEVAFEKLMAESRVRGMHSYGLVSFYGPSEAAPYGSLQKHIRYTADGPNDRPLERTIVEFDPRFTTIAHARFSTSGDWRGTNANAQPLVIGVGRQDWALAFNGVIHMGTKAEFEEDWEVKCETDNDGEIFLRRMEKGDTPEQFFAQLAGSFAGVWLRDGKLWAGRNARRPLWRCDLLGARWYASTQDIFARAGFEGMMEVLIGVESC